VFADNTDRHLSRPERDLIRAYLQWTAREDDFRTQYLPSPRLFVDLFYRPGWALLEAKANVRREVLRTALGQLLDYQRYFPRHPRLALLLPACPSAGMLELLAAKRVAVVWRTRGGAFTDSIRGALTSEIRIALH